MNANVPTALALNGQQGQKVSITLEKKGYKIGCKFWIDSLVVSWLSPAANPQLKIGSRILGYSNFDELYTFLLNASYPLTLTFDLPRSVAVSTQNETDTVPQALGPELRLVASHKKQGKDTKWRHKPIPMVNWPGWKKISGKIPMQYMSPEGVVFSTIQVANLYKKLLKLEQTEVMAWHEFKLWHGKRLFKGKPLIDYVKRAPRFDIPKQYIKCKQEDINMDDLPQQASKASIVGPGGFHFLSEASAKEFQEMFFSEGTVAMAWHLFKQKKKSTLMSHICGLPSWAIGTKPLEAQTREATKQLGPEWQVKTMARQSGKSANKAYYYYYSPILKQRFRSLARAKTFRAIVEECGSESKALKRLINKKQM